MRFLIDGYNLLHRLGLMHGRSGPSALDYARQRLLQMIRKGHGEESTSVTVVFDAVSAPPRSPAETNYQGIQVHFAVGHDEADDLIELMIREESVPQRLSVISDDHRIQQAARRRECRVMGCNEYLDWMDSRGRPSPPPPAALPVKPDEVSDAEKAHWLREFGEPEQERTWEELFETPDDGEHSH